MFLELVDASIALIGVGENNKFGHPNDAVLDRLKNDGTLIYRTDEMGEVVIKCDGAKYCNNYKSWLIKIENCVKMCYNYL